MVPHRHPLSRARRWPRSSLGLLLGPLVALVGCSGTTPAGSPVSSSDTAAAVADTFRLPADAQACLEGQFAADDTAREALWVTSELDDAQQSALATALEACMTDDQFAGAVAARITAAIPPADGDVATQVDCLTTELLALDDAHRRALMVGMVVVATAPPTGAVALARNDVLNGLYQACSVSIG